MLKKDKQAKPKQTCTQSRKKCFNSLHPWISVLVTLQLDIRIFSCIFYLENCTVKLIRSSVTLGKNPCCQKFTGLDKLLSEELLISEDVSSPPHCCDYLKSGCLFMGAGCGCRVRLSWNGENKKLKKAVLLAKFLKEMALLTILLKFVW